VNQRPVNHCGAALRWQSIHRIFNHDINKSIIKRRAGYFRLLTEVYL